MRKDPEFPCGVGGPTPPFDALLSLASWAALPVAVRVGERLADVLLALDDIREDLSSTEAADLRWLAAQLDDVGGTIHQLLQRLAS